MTDGSMDGGGSGCLGYVLEVLDEENPRRKVILASNIQKLRRVERE